MNLGRRRRKEKGCVYLFICLFVGAVPEQAEEKR